jgi:hypothetical protein
MSRPRRSRPSASASFGRAPCRLRSRRSAGSGRGEGINSGSTLPDGEDSQARSRPVEEWWADGWKAPCGLEDEF